MSEHEALRGAVETIASNPKVAAGIGVTTAAMGFAETLAAVNSVLGTVAIIAGIVATLLVVRVNWVNGKLLQKQLDKLEAEKP